MGVQEKPLNLIQGFLHSLSMAVRNIVASDGSLLYGDDESPLLPAELSIQSWLIDGRLEWVITPALGEEDPRYQLALSHIEAFCAEIAGGNNAIIRGKNRPGDDTLSGDINAMLKALENVRKDKGVSTAIPEYGKRIEAYAATHPMATM